MKAETETLNTVWAGQLQDDFDSWLVENPVSTNNVGACVPSQKWHAIDKYPGICSVLSTGQDGVHRIHDFANGFGYLSADLKYIAWDTGRWRKKLPGGKNPFKQKKQSIKASTRISRKLFKVITASYKSKEIKTWSTILSKVTG